MTFSEIMRYMFGGYTGRLTSPLYRLNTNPGYWNAGDVHGAVDFVPASNALWGYGDAHIYAPVSGTVVSIRSCRAQ